MMGFGEWREKRRQQKVEIRKKKLEELGLKRGRPIANSAYVEGLDTGFAIAFDILEERMKDAYERGFSLGHKRCAETMRGQYEQAQDRILKAAAIPVNIALIEKKLGECRDELLKYQRVKNEREIRYYEAQIDMLETLRHENPE